MQPDFVGPEGFQEATGVSRETLEKLKAYALLLEKWNSRINLVGRSTLKEMWWRHFYDAAQIEPHIPDAAKTLIDLGSGAGFPGLVLAALSEQLDVHLVESDTRKAAFLREAAREMSIQVSVHNKRIEQAELPEADVITARALATLEKLLEFSEPIRKKHGICLFLKGISAETELTESNKSWHIESTLIRSKTDPESCLLKVETMSRARRSDPE